MEHVQGILPRVRRWFRNQWKQTMLGIKAHIITVIIQPRSSSSSTPIPKSATWPSTSRVTSTLWAPARRQKPPRTRSLPKRPASMQPLGSSLATTSRVCCQYFPFPQSIINPSPNTMIMHLSLHQPHYSTYHYHYYHHHLYIPPPKIPPSDLSLTLHLSYRRPSTLFISSRASPPLPPSSSRPVQKEILPATRHISAPIPKASHSSPHLPSPTNINVHLSRSRSGKKGRNGCSNRCSSRQRTLEPRG